jgi:hypothetical protein
LPNSRIFHKLAARKSAGSVHGRTQLATDFGSVDLFLVLGGSTICK